MDISPEIVARMEALVRHSANLDAGKSPSPSAIATEARAIVALLPKPVDPDLLEAREIAKNKSLMNVNYSDGRFDEYPVVQSALAGIKRGRELAARDAS